MLGYYMYLVVINKIKLLGNIFLNLKKDRNYIFVKNFNGYLELLKFKWYDCIKMFIKIL